MEAGPSCRPAVAPKGYRLTAEGWQVAYANWSIRRQREPRLTHQLYTLSGASPRLRLGPWFPL